MNAKPVRSFRVFSTDLGNMAISGYGDCLCGLTFGHADEAAARGQMQRWASHAACELVEVPDWNDALVQRLEDYAAGKPDDFLDVEVQLPKMPFARRVVELCRAIPAGQTVSYAALAAQAGSPRAARAVGNTMAANPVPLIVPCHRVVGSRQELRGYSAAGGLSTKRRLLEMERGFAEALC